MRRVEGVGINQLKGNEFIRLIVNFSQLASPPKSFCSSLSLISLTGIPSIDNRYAFHGKCNFGLD